MTLEEIFEQLTGGELRSINLGGSRDTNKTVSSDNYFIVIPAINYAVQELHKRLPLRTASVTLEQQPPKTMYKLHSDYADSNASSSKAKYIRDSAHFPFRDTIVAVQNVYDMGGHELPINDGNNLHSVFTPSHNVVQFPYPREGYLFDVVYRDGLPKLSKTLTDDPADVHLDIPDYALAPLLHMITSRLTIGMIRGENSNNSMLALTQFETACQAIERNGLIITNIYSNTHVHDEGWK